MKPLFLFPLLTLPLSAQFLTPEWRGQPQSEHAVWDVFTEPKFETNQPDVVADAPTNDALLTCFTASAFLTSSGNIYSFQSATSFQMEDSTEFPISNVFLQISGLGSGIDPESVKLVKRLEDDTAVAIDPTRNFIINEETLTGEFGGEGTSYAYQWDLSDATVSGRYVILFDAAESSFSLDQVSLDTSANFEPVPEPAPAPPKIERAGTGFTLTWTGNWVLQDNATLNGSWNEVTEAITTTDGVHQLALTATTASRFFRLVKPGASASE